MCIYIACDIIATAHSIQAPFNYSATLILSRPLLTSIALIRDDLRTIAVRYGTLEQGPRSIGAGLHVLAQRCSHEQPKNKNAEYTNVDMHLLYAVCGMCCG